MIEYINYQPVIASLKERLRLLTVAIAVVEDLQRTDSFREAKQETPQAEATEYTYMGVRGDLGYTVKIEPGVPEDQSTLAGPTRQMEGGTR